MTVTGEHNNRWYGIEVLPSLFGGFVVSQSWGRVGKLASGGKRRLVDTLDEANHMVKRVRKLKNKYFKG